MTESKKTVEQWGMFEAVFDGPASGNPFIDTEMAARFSIKNRTVPVCGFYDGSGTYKVRFMPDMEGEWSFVVSSNRSELDGKRGSFICGTSSSTNHGPVRLKDRYHFTYEDGTAYYPVGTTCYVWNHQGEEMEKQTLETLKTAPFNKMRMCVFPKHYDFNHNEPEFYPFEGSPAKGWDFTRFNPDFFHHLEWCIRRLMDLGIECDLILFHPYDRWGYAEMDAESDDRYLRYIVARLASFRNMWWSLANEYDLMKKKDLTDWDRFFQIIQSEDPYQHLRSVHNCHEYYDHGKPWVTHCSIQHRDLTLVDTWQREYKKPVVVDECAYEGTVNHGWGNITAEELTRRFWEGFCRGGYVGHGETYYNEEEVLWWSKGISASICPQNSTSPSV